MYFRAAYNLPITLGLEHGVFAHHGLDLEITYTRGSRMSGAALVSGAQDLGALALDDVVYAVEKRHADLFAFMGYNSGTMQLMARPGIQSARDLAGRTLGVDDPDSGFANPYLGPCPSLRTDWTPRDAAYEPFARFQGSDQPAGPPAEPWSFAEFLVS